jgi:hypothetical protein
MQTREADGLSLLIFISIPGAGKRMVVDRRKDQAVRVQEVQSGRQARGQGRQYDQAGRFWFRADSMIRQAGSDSGQARVKTGRTSKREIRKSRRTGKTRWLTWQDQTNWHRETGNTGLNRPGKISGWGGDNHKDRWNRSGRDTKGTRTSNFRDFWRSLHK